MDGTTTNSDQVGERQAVRTCGRRAWRCGSRAGGRTSCRRGGRRRAVVSFCVISLTVGYLVSRRLQLPPRQSIAVSLEIGLHNAMLAIGIALSPQLLNNTEMATAGSCLRLLAPVIALAFIFIVRRVDPAFQKRPRPPPT